MWNFERECFGRTFRSVDDRSMLPRWEFIRGIHGGISLPMSRKATSLIELIEFTRHAHRLVGTLHRWPWRSFHSSVYFYHDVACSFKSKRGRSDANLSLVGIDYRQSPLLLLSGRLRLFDNLREWIVLRLRASALHFLRSFPQHVYAFP